MEKDTIKKVEEIELVEWTLDDFMSELRRISLVSEPAIEADFMMFSSELRFKEVDGEKRIITGPAMRPGMKIKRYRENGEPYWGFFSESVVRKAAELFFKNNSNSNKTNLEHEYELDGVYVFESWIVEDPSVDKSAALGFEGVKKGDWFISMKIENDVLWNNYLKTGIIKGFSVEVRADEKQVDEFKLIEEILDANLSDDWKINALMTLIDIDAKPYVDETGEIKKEPVEGFSESYSDYPEAAKKNAQIALDWAEKNGWGDCGTAVGKQRANQLAKGEPISEETISRMASFERHRQNSNKELGDGCGRLMWQAWGGDEGIEWAQRKLESLKTEEFGCPPKGDGKTVSGEPDKRCKDPNEQDDTKSKTKTKSEPKEDLEGKIITDPAEVKRLKEKSDKIKRPKVNLEPNDTDDRGQPIKAFDDDEINAMVDFHLNVPIGVTDRKGRVELEYATKAQARQRTVMELTGSFFNERDAEDFLQGRMTVKNARGHFTHKKGKGLVFACPPKGDGK